MSGRIRRCGADHTYTFSRTCPLCGRPTMIAHPARFSVQDRFGAYRRMAKEGASP